MEIDFKTVCDVCRTQNLTRSVYLSECAKCGGLYCTHFASAVDPQMCQNCCSDVTMTDEMVTKVVEHYSEETNKVYTKKSKARKVTFSGEDWLFYQRRIKDMNDTELLLAIEYHHAIYSAMMYEREVRRVEYAHRNAGKKITFPHSGSSAEVTTTKVQKTKTIKATSPDKAAANIKAILQQMLAQGMTSEQILAMMANKK